ncbi:serine/threonine protein kinase [Pyxidicoccus parkwayensis]|uniref:Serine/threonine protein kinase n=1 Tax=Pyxidicoccus parkwayensis TaxID=2813578 RepID=A0ABX7P722_9BACT|nr:serine/threonine-protein kinase [Pyxidicoccus parkwaysis]QSQ26284.1 serine/threonine protein kinase [Pyxidicoccus parkwaysis]
MSLQPGDRFGRYELVSWLGRGGMAETWRARLVGDAGVTKPVLIKKVLPEFSGDEAFISMFISEARISATLSHGNVAQVFDFGRVDGDYFLAMEYVDGQPLHRILKRAARGGLTALPIPLSTFIALEMCRGLHYAHTRTDEKGQPLGIVHRDISPDNVLVSYEGQVKIVDFGIAKARSLRTFNTEPGVVKGKYLFFSPEQARGKEVDARTDVWATGLVLYELLCGQRPVTGLPQTVMMRMARGDFPSPRELRGDLPAALDALVMRALAVDLSARFESSHAFGDALAGFLYGFAPRFSSMNLAHLVRELFREELAKEGRELPVPPSFQEELALWRSTAPHSDQGRSGGGPPPLGRKARQTAIAHAPTHETKPEAKPASSPRVSRGALVAGGAGLLLSLGAAAVLMSTWLEITSPPGHDPSSPQPLPARVLKQVAVEAPAAPVEAPKQAAVVAPAEATATTASAREAPDAGTAENTAPGMTFQLEARRDVILVPRSFVAATGLTPAMKYEVSEISRDLRLDPSPVRVLKPSAFNVPPIFYLLSGPGVPEGTSLGEVKRNVSFFVGASDISFFTLSPPSPGSPLPRTIQLASTQVGSEKELDFRPKARSASLDTAALLAGLSPSTTYSVTLTSSGGVPTLIHGPGRGLERRIACIQWSPSAPAEDASAGWPVAFILDQFREVLIEGVEALKCGFVDDDPSDNVGLMAVRVVPVGRSGQDRPSSQRLVNDARRLEQANQMALFAKELLRGGRSSTATLSEVLDMANRCLGLVPDHADCLLISGSTLARLNRKDDAASRYRRFIEHHPDHPRAPAVRQILEAYARAHNPESQRPP